MIFYKNKIPIILLVLSILIPGLIFIFFIFDLISNIWFLISSIFIGLMLFSIAVYLFFAKAKLEEAVVTTTLSQFKKKQLSVLEELIIENNKLRKKNEEFKENIEFLNNVINCSTTISDELRIGYNQFLSDNDKRQALFRLNEISGSNDIKEFANRKENDFGVTGLVELIN